MTEQVQEFSRVVLFASAPEATSRTVLGSLVAPRVVLVDTPERDEDVLSAADAHVSAAVAHSGSQGLHVDVREGRLYSVDHEVDASGALIFVELDRDVTATPELLEELQAESSRDALLRAAVVHRRRARQPELAPPPGVEVPNQRSLFCELLGIGCPRN